MSDETLFHEALAKPPAERAAFLDAACAGQPELRQAVEALLAAHSDHNRLIDRPAIEMREGEAAPGTPPLKNSFAFLHEQAGQSLPPLEERGTVPPLPLEEQVTVPPDAVVAQTASALVGTGAVIAGRYRLETLLGEGGMGAVWIAQQTEPVKRTVALKLIKPGMDSKAVLQRFEAERQALALMDHPHIARVLDGGVTPAGQPFFVMELVQGQPLTQFCDGEKLPPRQRLELFVPICQAVQHAHQKGIVHRDLKPANIIVALIDGKPVPKVIDFGVAKAIGGKLTEESLATQFGAVVGTLEYMAPEQAGLSGQDVDTRADIYALGVILYELLTGMRPFDAKHFQQAALFDMIRILLEEEPSKPSTRLSTAEALPSLAAVRQTEPKKLMAMLRGELDWVVMKCLEKQRDRRYETANGLAREIQRYLANEPVEARPPSAGYRLKKFVTRHKGQVIAVSLALFLLVAGIVGTTWGMLEADAKRIEAENAAAAEKTARLAEERERKYAEGINRFVVDDFLALTSAEGQDRFDEERKRALGKDATLEQLLDRAAGKLQARTDLAPRIEAQLSWIIGVNYRANGVPHKAIPFLERAKELSHRLHGPDQPPSIEASNSLAGAYYEAGRNDRAVPLWEDTLQRVKTKLGPRHEITLTTQNNLATGYAEIGQHDRALTLHEEVLKGRQATNGPEHEDTLRARYQVAIQLYQLKQPDRARPLLEETLRLMRTKLGLQNIATLTCMTSLAACHVEVGRFDLALPLYEEALQGYKNKLGSDHSKTLNVAHGLADCLERMGRLEQALPHHEAMVRSRQAKLGPEHPDTLQSMINLVYRYQDANQLDRAVVLWETLAERYLAKFGANHPDTLTIRNNLAQCYANLGRYDNALLLLETTWQGRRAALGADHPESLIIQHNLAVTYRKAGHLGKAIPLLEETLRLRQQKLGRRHADTLLTAGFLGMAYNDAQRFDEALPVLAEVFQALQGIGRQQTGDALYEAYRRTGQTDAAAKLLATLLAEARAQLPQGSPALGGRLAQLGMAMVNAKAYVEAEPLLRESLTIREKTQPDAWPTFNTQSLLGGALLSQKKYAEAEPLLRKGYEGMKQREKTIPPQGKARLTEALERVVQLYEATGKQDEAAKWRKELEATKAALTKREAKP